MGKNYSYLKKNKEGLKSYLEQRVNPEGMKGDFYFLNNSSLNMNKK